MITVVLPVYNEEQILKKSVLELYGFLKNNLKEDWQIVIASNGSTDQTDQIGKRLGQILQGIHFIRTEKQGKGRAIRQAWTAFPAEISIFMDIDLATGLEALPRLLQTLKNGNDLVYGSRFHKKSSVQCSQIRKFLSRTYSFIFRFLLHSKLQDPSCGFKAINQKVFDSILPKVKDNSWFFDSELAFLTEKARYEIQAIPIHWTEQRDPTRKSKVPFSLVWTYLWTIWSLRKRKYEKQ